MEELLLLLLFINCNWAYARWQCSQKGYTVNKEHSTLVSRKDATYISRYFTIQYKYSGLIQVQSTGYKYSEPTTSTVNNNKYMN
jgi:hypothetical protein